MCKLLEALKSVNEKNISSDPTLESSNDSRLNLGVCSPELGIVGVGAVTSEAATSKMKQTNWGGGTLKTSFRIG